MTTIFNSFFFNFMRDSFSWYSPGRNFRKNKSKQKFGASILCNERRKANTKIYPSKMTFFQQNAKINIATKISRFTACLHFHMQQTDKVVSDDGWIRVLHPFNSISVISRWWEGEDERLCAMNRRLGSGRISPPAGFEPATPYVHMLWVLNRIASMRRF